MNICPEVRAAASARSMFRRFDWLRDVGLHRSRQCIPEVAILRVLA